MQWIPTEQLPQDREFGFETDLLPFDSPISPARPVGVAGDCYALVNTGSSSPEPSAHEVHNRRVTPLVCGKTIPRVKRFMNLVYADAGLHQYTL